MACEDVAPGSSAPSPSAAEADCVATAPEGVSSCGSWEASGTSPDDSLVEFVELPREVHPYYVSTQAHPELRSRPTRPHPLFSGLVGAAIARQRELRFPIDESSLRRTSADGAEHPADELVSTGSAADRDG